jgi:hypothetical protein
VPAKVPFRMKTGDHEAAFDLMDLSESGVRIRCGSPMVPMTKVKVGMVLPGKRVGSKADVSFETTGVVVWSHKVPEGAFDTGVFFPDLDDRQRGMLRAFVASHAPQAG